MNKCYDWDNNLFKYKRHYDAFVYALRVIENSELFPFLEMVILFGSCARGEASYSSDVDLLLIFSERIESVPRYLKKYRILRSEASVNELNDAEVDFKLCIGNSWLTSTATIYQCIRRDGIVIWERD